MKKNIECEIRADVSGNFEEILGKLTKTLPLISKTNRLSVMFFGKIKNKEIDVRIRITNGQAEIAVKKGAWHAADRTELSQLIAPADLLNFVRMFLLFDFDDVRVGEREAYNFAYGKDIIISLVKAGKVGYLEIEKLVARKDFISTKSILHQVADEYGAKVVQNRKEFLKLCSVLAEEVDWEFLGKVADFKRLNLSLRTHLKDKN